ncbi:TPA: hypothetical protein ACN32D_004238 [Vibrio parahaemolyticus]|nr:MULTISPECIES: hypothetical protein [Vibrio]KIT50116.1 hypothetical protein H337_23695 [Vibrio parahaemolyticus EN9701121]EGQ7914766.1 hypothetical protein [Vibrio parahaemolyticus]EGQ9863897.1 hypothetical protein [Vibrio parahaemolyticus]EGR2913474.1 hypothetical protein [Vibrio parahaemolyticus]EGR3154849.1 hypothetical protein [Vibrio parahaemolyticus]
MDIRIQAVVISSVVAISLFFIRDLLLPKLKATKEEKKQKIEIYKKYAEPLGKSAESMFWRLNEIFSNGTKAKFLERGKVITDFDNYKYISTLYRLGALLGWITAIKKEQSYIRASNDGDSKKLLEALNKLEKSLADGPHTEENRARYLCEIWSIEVPQAELMALGSEISRIVKHELKVSEVQLISDLSADRNLEVARQCADYLCDSLDIARIADEQLRVTQFDVAKRLAIREAWIYRDWQTGIGELMLVKSESKNRTFDVIGYKEFEAMFESEEPEHQKWVKRLGKLFDGVAVNNVDANDMRIEQLQKTYKSIANLIITIQESEVDLGLLGTETIGKAKSVCSEA